MAVPSPVTTTREWNVSPKVFVGNLQEGTSKEDLKEVFQRYGKIREMWLFPTFAFLEFEDEVQAENAVRALGDPTAGLPKAKKLMLEMRDNPQMRGGRGGRGGGSWSRGGRRDFDPYPTPAPSYPTSRGGDPGGSSWRGGGVIEGTLPARGSGDANERRIHDQIKDWRHEHSKGGSSRR